MPEPIRPPQPFDVTEFRFRDDDDHNARMLEHQAEKAMRHEQPDRAALFAIGAALYRLISIGDVDDRA